MKQDIKKKVLRRLAIIEGQVKGLQRMVADEAYCIDVITQTSAVRQALSSVEDAMLENHISTCVVAQMKRGAHAQATEEIVSVYKLAKKK